MKPQLSINSLPPAPASWTEIKTLLIEATSVLNMIINSGEGASLIEQGQDLCVCVCVQVRVCLCIWGPSLSLPGTPRPLGTPAHPFFLPHQDGGGCSLLLQLWAQLTCLVARVSLGGGKECGCGVERVSGRQLGG